MAYALSQPRTALFDLSADVEALGVFKPNREAPFHRWVHLTEGFSARLVAAELANDPDARLVYDPFGGTGTTPLVAAEMGRHGTWAEVNPYLREAATIKVEAACADPEQRQEIVATLRRLLQLGPIVDQDADGQHPLAIANEARDFFSDEALAELLGWLRRFDTATGLARRVGLLSVATSAIHASNMKRAVDLRRRTEKEMLQSRPAVSEAVQERVSLMISDLNSTPVAEGSATNVSTDARTLPEDFGPIELVVTSPPYLNGTNYCRNTKLELLLLSLIQNEDGLMDIRSRSVTAGINNVSKRIREPTLIPAVEEVALKLDECAYDVRIPKMVRAYFSDMQIVMGTTRSAMKPGGRMVLDIGDSRFAGVHIDVPTLLSRIAEDGGWEIEDVEVIRNRVSKDGNPLCQKLLRLCSR
ncbi:site-specific DNA-methyltransferase [Paraconexibacter antarcticus]|uniref:site-specific DNA-methyltransferase (cytosine-N(4)-specific) n=1 Tax=Paraconexibacter antarcticus TaxID=2949664 RepID=A0ABY5DXM8_9ACTN|nr:site-specific DNA-methyltransferase [Paraconexibacter antarcticus]UTI65881.1 site-specific DNA-methyltransferase [Paraconexibacter antarcticus]